MTEKDQPDKTERRQVEVRSSAMQDAITPPILKLHEDVGRSQPDEDPDPTPVAKPERRAYGVRIAYPVEGVDDLAKTSQIALMEGATWAEIKVLFVREEAAPGSVMIQGPNGQPRPTKVLPVFALVWPDVRVGPFGEKPGHVCLDDPR